MEARGDFSIYNEPTHYAFISRHYKDVVGSWYREGLADTFALVKEQFYKDLEHSNVFAKEMSFAVHEFLLEDLDFISDKRVQFVFLIRDPHAVTISFYRKQGGLVRGLNEIVGMRRLYDIYELVVENSANMPIVFFAHDLYDQPETTLRSFCNQVSIPYTPHMLHFEPHDETFTGVDEWHELKYPEHIHHWHGQAIRSSTIGRPTDYEVDADGLPTFSEIAPQDQEILREVYEENLLYYHLFCMDKRFHLQHH